MVAAVNRLLFCPPRQMIWNKGLGEGGDGGMGEGGGSEERWVGGGEVGEAFLGQPLQMRRSWPDSECVNK